MKNHCALLVCVLAAANSTADVREAYAGISIDNPTGSRSISSAGLVAAYDFETYTKEGLLWDFGPFGSHGKAAPAKEVNGLFGKARVFETLRDVVDIPEVNMNLLGPLTVAAWLKLSTPNLHQHIFSCDDIFVLWTTIDNQYRLADTQANGITTTKDSAPIERWHSVIAVLSATQGEALNENNVSIYIDGQKAAGDIEPIWAPATLRKSDGCLIGAAVSGTPAHRQLHFDGVLDELHVFSRALTEQEIRIYSTRESSAPGRGE